MELDDIDKQLLQLLQEDSKKTTKQYALALGLSTTAVYERIRKLERNGILVKYVALIDASKVKRDFTVLCQVRLTQHTKENVLLFEKAVQQLQEVLECHHVSGEYDYLLKISVENMQAYRDFMVAKLTAIPNIGNTQSSFVISKVKNSTAIYI